MERNDLDNIWRYVEEKFFFCFRLSLYANRIDKNATIMLNNLLYLKTYFCSICYIKTKILGVTNF